MCIAPITLYGPEGAMKAACHKCWQCRERAVNDWVGRNIAESKTATACHAMTLTYGRDRDRKSETFGQRDHVRAAVLTYSDIQKYFKRLRFHGYPCRYFVIGEYGSKKGRAHWHAMVYWQGEVPPHKLRENFRDALWPEGWQFWDEPSVEAIRYCCKYIQKDTADDKRQYVLRMSKKPPLGTKWFEQYAERFVRQGLAPQTLQYSWPEIKRRRNGEVIKFMMKDVVANNFCAHYVKTWMDTYPGKHMPASELIEEWIDSITESPEDTRTRLIWEAAQRYANAWKPKPTRWGPRTLDEARADIEIWEAKYFNQGDDDGPPQEYDAEIYAAIATEIDAAIEQAGDGENTEPDQAREASDGADANPPVGGQKYDPINNSGWPD